jgi:hypothetical protein
VGCSARAALGTREGDSCFLLGGEAVISTCFLFLYLLITAITSLSSSWQSELTRKVSIIECSEKRYIILMTAKVIRPAAGRIANWSMQKMMRTEVMLSSPELLVEFVRVATV